MSNNKSKLFTIGQFAALHEINKKTLMWYDEVGIFSPAAVKENGYRYYTYYQSVALETILMLREMNISIEEIRRFMENRSAETLEVLLAEKIAELDASISRLKRIRKTLVGRKEEVSELLKMNLAEISIVEKQEQYLTIVNTSRDTPVEQDIERVLSETKKKKMDRLQGISYGAMILTDSLYRGDFEDYTALFLERPGSKTKKGVHIQPAGNYLRAYCKGSWDHLPLRYQEILKYAKLHHLKMYGYSYEMGINEIAIDSMDEYITQIEIPIYTD